MRWQNSEISKPLTNILNRDFDDTATSMFNRKEKKEKKIRKKFKK